jgi:hypothetical protein
LCASSILIIHTNATEDYVYHKDHFALVDFPPTVRKKILALEGAA